jgi:hypothetical protein
MKLLIDNTGIQSTGMCLQKRARSEDDAKELIQLGTLLVFSDELIINTIGSNQPVIQESQKVITRLSEIGVGQTFIRQNKDENSYWLACEQAAEMASEGILEILASSGSTSTLSNGVSTSTVPVGYQTKDIERTWNLFIRVGENSISVEELLEKKESAKLFYTSGATDYMLAHSPNLQESVRILLREKESENWSVKDILQLQVFLRSYLNDILAKQQGAYYTPSVSRAQYVRQQNAVMFQKLQAVIDNSVSKAREPNREPLAIPSIASTLLHNSEGNPEKFIEEALKLREKTIRIRKEAAQWLNDFSYDFDGLSNTSKKLAELSAVLETELGLKQPLKLLDTIEMQINLVVPVFKFNLGKVHDWAKYIHNRKKYVVLTEISKSAAFISSDRVEKSYQKLYRY